MASGMASAAAGQPDVVAFTRPRSPAATDELVGKVRAVAAPTEYRIGVEVDDPDPERAQQIANAAAAGFVDKVKEEAAGNERWEVWVQVLEQAQTPASPVSPRPKRDALGAAILGALIGAAVVFVIEFWDDTVRSADEAAALFAVPVLAAIPNEATKTGVTHGLAHGLGRRRPAGRGRLHPAALAGRGGVSDAPH